VIPAELRKKYGLEEGVKILFHDDDGRLTLEPSSFAAVYALQGALKNSPLEEALQAEREAERLREDRK
jgi:bifunctional DNA-binding transcriptional regulator/antitoxin component of YhaV-PrlF toxin-antitoxin module